jgi:predicted  nucleic acid-binding Zn-ribbon protein
MGATLDALRQLQDIETRLRSIHGQVESKRRSLRGHKQREASLLRQISEHQQLIKSAQGEADRIELDRKSHEQHIAKLREALNQAKTNKEYAAALTQLNTDKADSLKLEDTVLAALGRVDELKKKEADLRAVLEKQRAHIEAAERAAEEEEARVAQLVSELEAQRQEAADKVPPEALNLFERACDRHDGEAMAAVQQAHPRRIEYTCGGCNMSIPLETVNALQSRDEAQTCQSCLRLLYLDATEVTVR